MAVGALEERFYDRFAHLLGLTPDEAALRGDPARWDDLKEAVAARFRTRTRAAWTALFEGTDACVAPVLSLRRRPRTRTSRPAARSPATAGSPSPRPHPGSPRPLGTVRRPPAQPGADAADIARDWDVPAIRPTEGGPR